VNLGFQNFDLHRKQKYGFGINGITRAN